MADVKAGARRRARAGLLAPGVRHRAGRVPGRRSARHRDRRRAERAADGRRRCRAGRRACSCRTSSTSRSTSTPTSATSSAGTSRDSSRCARRSSAIRARTSTATRRSSDERGGRDGARHLADDQRRQPAREHQADARARAARAREGRRSRRAARPAAADLSRATGCPVCWPSRASGLEPRGAPARFGRAPLPLRRRSRAGAAAPARASPSRSIATNVRYAPLVSLRSPVSVPSENTSTSTSSDVVNAAVTRRAQDDQVADLDRDAGTAARRRPR